MDKNKVADLAKSFGSSCKQIMKDKKVTQKFSSPTVVMLALTVAELIVSEDLINRSKIWSQT